jgi:hypothetical protein
MPAISLSLSGSRAAMAGRSPSTRRRKSSNVEPISAPRSAARSDHIKAS